MLILSADTSGRQGSIALARGELSADRNAVEVIEVVSLEGGNFSAQMVPQIAALLVRHGFGKNDIGGFAVASGPGSFTGLRVGQAAIKGLAEVLGKPIAAMSLLEALALTSATQGGIFAALDAGRGEVYAGEYEVTGELAKLLREELLSREEFLVKARNATVVTSDEKIAETAKATGVTVSVIRAIDAGTIARLGWRKLHAGETVSPERLEANYIRRTDAEILAKVSP
jgi:tRNA threonylcarbamoyladenosine biosynthesis protein TsaB